MLAGTIGERNLWSYGALERAAQYISMRLTASGYTPRRQTYELAKLPLSNVEAVLEGTARAAEIVVVGAHYDTVVGCPGANDNATGVAAVLELAQRFSGRPQPRTIRFVAFVNEEPPFFQTAHMGSAVYANAARSRGDRVAGMLSLETMGYYSEEKGSQRYPAPMAALYPDVGNFIGFVANIGSARLLWRARRAFKRRTSFPLQSAAVPAAIPGVGWSDHWAFWQAGYPAMMVTDTAPFRYPGTTPPTTRPTSSTATGSRMSSMGSKRVIEAIGANPQIAHSLFESFRCPGSCVLILAHGSSSSVAQPRVGDSLRDSGLGGFSENSGVFVSRTRFDLWSGRTRDLRIALLVERDVDHQFTGERFEPAAQPLGRHRRRQPQLGTRAEQLLAGHRRAGTPVSSSSMFTWFCASTSRCRG